jgi:hypothetical protein
MLELLALLLSTSASVFKSTERLEAKNLVVPIENLILEDRPAQLRAVLPAGSPYAVGDDNVQMTWRSSVQVGHCGAGVDLDLCAWP